MKKRKFALIFCVFALIYIVGSTVYDNIEYSKMSLEEKVMEVMSVEKFQGDKPYVDNILLLEEVEGGYFCVSQSTEYDEINFGYIKDKKVSLNSAGCQPRIFKNTSIRKIRKIFQE